MAGSEDKKINIFSNNSEFGSVGNPFNMGSLSGDKVKDVYKPVKRLNGYDSTILNKETFNEEQELSMDYRIKEKEAFIKELDNRIKTADDFGNQNEALGLKAKRQRLMQELASLKRNQTYSGHVLGESLKEKMPIIHKMKDFISRYILAKISKKVSSIVTLTDSLEQLSNISKNVDELIDLNVPYGERIQNYEKLTEYLNKANRIHSNISKSMGRKV